MKGEARICFCITFTVVLLLLPGVIEADSPDEPYKFFREFVGLNEQTAAIRSGKAVAKVVESRTPDEVFVFGGTTDLLHNGRTGAVVGA